MADSRLIPHYMKAPEPSSYHEVCVKNATVKPTEKMELDFVSQAEIWKQAVRKEICSVKEWETNWGFLTEYDDRGNRKEPKPLPKNLTVYSNTVPTTNSGNYGSQVNTDIGQTLQELEFRFYAEQRRRKMGRDMVCY